MSELKTCPFCGGEAKLHDDINIIPIIDETGAYIDADVETSPAWVECTICGATGETFDNDEDADAENAIEAWNRRAAWNRRYKEDVCD